MNIETITPGPETDAMLEADWQEMMHNTLANLSEDHADVLCAAEAMRHDDDELSDVLFRQAEAIDDVMRVVRQRLSRVN